MNTIEIHNQKLYGSYVSNDGSTAYSMFFQDGLDDVSLHFSIEQMNGEEDSLLITPTNISYNKVTLNSGDKIVIDIADNGFIIKHKGATQIVPEQHDLNSHLNKICHTTEEFIVDYNLLPAKAEFTNLDEIIQEIKDKLVEL